MDILEYDQVDPIGVLHLNLLSLGYPLTQELAARMRQLDPRVFPCFGVYAVEDGVVAGQVLLYRIPVQTTSGPDEVGARPAIASPTCCTGVWGMKMCCRLALPLRAWIAARPPRSKRSAQA